MHGRAEMGDAAMTFAGRDGLNHDRPSEGDEMRKLIVNASLALGGAALTSGEAMRETGAERSSSTKEGDRKWLPTR